jgi:hypothetical protein
MIGCVDPHVGHWKSANSSTVTAAVGEPSMFGGVAPTGAFGLTVADLTGVDPGLALLFVFRLRLAVEIPRSADTATSTRPMITTGMTVLLFVRFVFHFSYR